MAQQKQTSPVAIVIAIIVVLVVLWVIYKFTLGKPKPTETGAEAYPGVPSDRPLGEPLGGPGAPPGGRAIPPPP